MNKFLNLASSGMKSSLFSDATLLVKNNHMQTLLNALKINARWWSYSKVGITINFLTINMLLFWPGCTPELNHLLYSLSYVHFVFKV